MHIDISVNRRPTRVDLVSLATQLQVNAYASSDKDGRPFVRVTPIKGETLENSEEFSAEIVRLFTNYGYAVPSLKFVNEE